MADGEQVRWRRVFEAEQGRIWRAVLAHGGDPDLAADAVAEAFAQGIRRGGEVRDPAAWAWRSAFRIADGLLADRRRTGPATDPRTVDRPDPGALPDDVVVLVDALARLPDADRRVVVLSLVGGLGAPEIAAITGGTAGAVRVRLHRARRRLRDALTDALPAPEEIT